MARREAQAHASHHLGGPTSTRDAPEDSNILVALRSHKMRQELNARLQGESHSPLHVLVAGLRSVRPQTAYPRNIFRDAQICTQAAEACMLIQYRVCPPRQVKRQQDSQPEDGEGGWEKKEGTWVTPTAFWLAHNEPK